MTEPTAPPPANPPLWRSRDAIALASGVLLVVNVQYVRPAWRRSADAGVTLQREATEREARLGRQLPDEAEVVAELGRLRGDARRWWAASGLIGLAGFALGVAYVILERRASCNPYYDRPPVAMRALSLLALAGNWFYLMVDVVPWLLTW